MANFVYPSARTGGTGGAPPYVWLTDTIDVSLVSGYTPDTSHVYLSDVLGAGGTIAATQTLASKTAAGGVYGAANVVFPSVASGPTCAYLIVYKSTGNNSTSNVILCIDTATNLPVTPNGGPIDCNWDTGPNLIFTP